MVVNMIVGSPVEAVDELGCYRVGEITSVSEVTVEVAFLVFGEEHNRVFAIPLAKHTISPVTKKGWWLVIVFIVCMSVCVFWSFSHHGWNFCWFSNLEVDRRHFVLGPTLEQYPHWNGWRGTPLCKFLFLLLSVITFMSLIPCCWVLSPSNAVSIGPVLAQFGQICILIFQ